MSNIGWLEVIFLPLLLVFVGAFVWALVDAIRRPESQYPNGQGKTVWVVGLIVGWIVALGWLVGIAYLIVVRKKMGPVRSTPSGAPPLSDAPPPPPQA